jgi:hypothetical protein
MSLLATTQERLDRVRAAGVSLRAIAEGSAGRVDYEWLKKFAQGKTANPGVNTIESLNNRLMELAPEPELKPVNGSSRRAKRKRLS